MGKKKGTDGKKEVSPIGTPARETASPPPQVVTVAPSPVNPAHSFPPGSVFGLAPSSGVAQVSSQSVFNAPSFAFDPTVPASSSPDLANVDGRKKVQPAKAPAAATAGGQVGVKLNEDFPVEVKSVPKPAGVRLNEDVPLQVNPGKQFSQKTAPAKASHASGAYVPPNLRKAPYGAGRSFAAERAAQDQPLRRAQAGVQVQALDQAERDDWETITWYVDFDLKDSRGPTRDSINWRAFRQLVTQEPIQEPVRVAGGYYPPL